MTGALSHFAHAAALGLAVTLAIAALVWLISLPLHDASIVDIAWSVLILVTPIVAFMVLPQPGTRATPVLLLAGLWAVRLAGYIARRHQGEDRRYRAIRARNEPYFAWKSLYLVFALQAVLAWVVSMPLLASVASDASWSWLDVVGIALFLFGFLFESVSDLQLARFKAKTRNRKRVMTEGLWRYSRHPNYFGEWCVWWGLWIVALAGGAWWTVVSPLVMTLLLLKVSGVTLLERDIVERRPGYDDYVARTNAFYPWKPRA